LRVTREGQLCAGDEIVLVASHESGQPTVSDVFRGFSDDSGY
jgi:hypothetical protein